MNNKNKIFPNTPYNTIDTFVLSILGCDCAQHVTYFIVKENNLFYEYIFNAQIENNSYHEYSYLDVKPIITQILFFLFKEFYDVFENNNENILKLIDDSCKNNYVYDEKINEFKVDVDKYYKSYLKHNENIKYKLSKYDSTKINKLHDKINFYSNKHNIEMSKFLINDEIKSNKTNKNFSYYCLQNKN